MIAVHLEPKGLKRGTPALADFYACGQLTDDAVTGSARLRDAILRVHFPMPRAIAQKAPAFRRRKCRRGRPKTRSYKVRKINPRIEQIKALIAAHYGISVKTLLRPCKSYRVSHPRQIAMYLARKTTTASYPDIGSQFGGKDHTTVLHSFREVEKRIAAGHVATIEALVAVHAVIGA